jgi:hypothetical protein
MEIQIVPLVPNVELPRRASPRTRAAVPPGYGVQEQCLPFTAASALGFLIPAPITFGLCPLNEAPDGCRTFRSPISTTGPQQDWVFYVKDQPASRFAGNAYSFRDVPVEGAMLEPGLSFFDREDQQDLFKLHLPYIWRTQPGIDILFLPLLNRPSHGLEVQSGLVETDWYTNPVNLIVRRAAHPVHIESGTLIAQAIPIARELRDASIETAAEHARLTRDARKGLAEWHRQHAQDRGAYKKLARDTQGIDPQE